ncbi:MAG TPA: hypothetical protein VFF28_00165 [Candidatus Nanoarchaeia archaeon]|nr:hypothetical protein [Candidatus Nanoarchaeia archaeon]
MKLRYRGIEEHEQKGVIAPKMLSGLLPYFFPAIYLFILLCGM